jgi:hypothetical protein
MSAPINHQAYAKTKLLVEAIDRRDSSTLEQNFGISSSVADEIYECIEDYFVKDTKISIAPEEKAFDLSIKRRPYIDVYETNEKAIGLECVLFADGAPGEAILHLEVSEVNGMLMVYYKYIGF